MGEILRNTQGHRLEKVVNIMPTDKETCECNECALRRCNDRQRETINKLLGRIESLKGALRGAIDAHTSNAGEWQKDERIDAARAALKGKA